MPSGLENMPDAQRRWIEQFLSEGVDDVALASSPDDLIYIGQSDVLVIDPGSTDLLGRYVYTGHYLNYPRFHLEGHTPGDNTYSVGSNGSFLVITDSSGVEMYQAALADNPWDAVWSATGGVDPVPTVARYPATKIIDRSKLNGVQVPIILTANLTTTLAMVGRYFVLPDNIGGNKVLTIDDTLAHAPGSWWAGANTSASRTLGVALQNNPGDLLLAGTGASGTRMSVAPYGEFTVNYIKSSSGGQDIYLIKGTGITVVP